MNKPCSLLVDSITLNELMKPCVTVPSNALSGSQAMKTE